MAGGIDNPDLSIPFEHHPSDERFENSIMYSATTLYLSGDEEDELDETRLGIENGSIVSKGTRITLETQEESVQHNGDDSSWKGLLSKDYDDELLNETWQGDDSDDHSSIPFDGIDEFSYLEQEGNCT